MKTFRMIGMALFAVLLSVNFASCGGSDNEPFEEEKEEDVVASKKKLIEMTWENKYGTLSYKFTYDSKGQLSQLECGTIEEDGKVTYQEKYKYDWSNNLITISSNVLPGFKCTCKLENGLITDINESFYGYKFTLNYDESQKMIEFNSNKTRNAYIWGENSLIKFSQFTTDNIEIESTINYQNYLNNYGWLDFDLECLNMSSLPIYIRCLVISNSELLGKHFFSNLPKKITTELYSKFWDFTFKLDEDGYVQQCKVSDHYKNNDNYTYKWQ